MANELASAEDKGAEMDKYLKMLKEHFERLTIKSQAPRREKLRIGRRRKKGAKS